VRTYSEFLKNVDENFVRLCLLGVQLLNGLLDGGGGHGAGFEKFGSPGRSGLFGGLRFGRNQDRLIDYVLSDVLSGDELGVSVVDDLVDDLIDEHEVFSDALLIEHAAVVAEDLHHSVNDVQDRGWRHVRLASRHKVNAELLCEKVVHAVYVLHKGNHKRKTADDLGVSLREAWLASRPPLRFICFETQSRSGDAIAK